MTEQDAKTDNTWTFKGVELPLYAFDVKPVITLPNGSVHYFRMWDEVTEKKREDLLKSIIVTSPAVINGENPRDVKTDFTRSLLAYYEMMIERIGGIALDGDTGGTYDAKQVTDTVLPNGKQARVMDLLPAPIRKAAAARLYGGNIEIERDEDEDIAPDFDPFAEIPDIQVEVKRAEDRREVYRLNAERVYVIKHELGVETLRNGQRTKPTHVIRYHFREPDGEHFSRWEMKGSKGFALSLPKGGTRAETFYNLETLKQLFDALIERIEGASLNGQPIELPSDRQSEHRKAILAQVPLAIKKLTVATLFQEMSNLGNF